MRHHDIVKPPSRRSPSPKRRDGTNTAIAAGELATVTGHGARLSGHPATSVADLLGTGRFAY